ncbi:hypothetical protein [Pontiella sulfatireligans]|uniref:Terminase small subunit n=1 Tax=Pontiella sulfatireligans TaxID=2750658 RepID=A0A6C2UE49_9BACT|nr:hypothetical protein [Pontiella sulfatireligans]VGO18398.1 hypothetical protein SCARR_00450 [Pontiella sulfatireligans]
MKRSDNKYAVLEGQRLEMGADHAELYGKYTVRQLRYVLARMIFPEESHAACARQAGYAPESAGVRALELERRPHVRLMLSRCEWKPRDVDPEAMKRELKKSDVTLMLSHMIRDPAVPIRKRLSAARQLATLNGWIGEKNQHKDEKSILADMMKAIDGTSIGLPSRTT